MKKKRDNYVLKSIKHEMYFQKLKNLHYLFSVIEDAI